MESDFQISNKYNYSSSDSCFDIDVDNVDEHKKLSISKQEQINWKVFLQLFSQSIL